MANFEKAVFRLMYGQVPVECHITSEDESSLTVDEIQNYADFLIEKGFTPPSSYNRSADNIGKRGVVVAVSPVPNTKMYEVTGKLDHEGGEFKWREFNATTFRIHDRFEVVKNDRGFKAGQLVTDDLEQKKLGTDDISF